MLINDIDISQYQATLLDRVISTNEIDSFEDWNDGAVSSIFIRQKNSFRKIKLTFLIKSESEEQAFLNISKLTQNIKKSELVFNDLSNLKFSVTLNTLSKPERLVNGVFKVIYELNNSYAEGDTCSFNLQDTSKKYNLKILYCKDNEFNLIRKVTKVIYPELFSTTVTLDDLIDVNEYRPEYYQEGQILNILPDTLTYEDLVNIDTIIVVYNENSYNISFNYYSVNDSSLAEPVFLGNEVISITNSDVNSASSIVDIIDINKYKPIDNIVIFNENFNNVSLKYLILNTPFSIYYMPKEQEKTKQITVQYYNNETLNSQEEITLNEFDFYPYNKLSNVIDIDKYLDKNLYQSGVIQEEKYNNIVSFDDIIDNDTITVVYNEKPLTLSFSYYKNNVYIATTYLDVFASDFTNNTTLISLGFNPNLYLPQYYENSQNFSNIVTYEQLLQNPYTKINYTPKSYNLSINYYKDVENSILLGEDHVAITVEDYNKASNYYNLISLDKFLPENYKFNSINPNTINSFSELINLKEIQVYYSKINSTVITEPDYEKGKKYWVFYFKDFQSSAFDSSHYLGRREYTLTSNKINANTVYKDIMYLDQFCPSGYNLSDAELYHGASVESLKISLNKNVTYEDFVEYDEDNWYYNKGDGEYYVIYKEPSKNLLVKYYIDSVSDKNFINSEIVSYTTIQANEATSFTDIGVDINKYKPGYCNDGTVLYDQAINAENLMNLQSLNIIYPYNSEIIDLPDETTSVYPNRILYVLGDKKTNIDLGVGRGYAPSDITVQVSGRYSKISTSSTGNGYMFSAHPLENGMRLAGDTLFVGGGYEESAYKVYKSTSVGNNGVSYEDISKYAISDHALTGVQGGDFLDVKYNGATLSRREVNDSYLLTENIHVFSDSKDMYPGAYIEISAMKIYIQNELIRDLIPVARGDIIGKLVAPSNCFFDKVTRTFFESKNTNFIYAKEDPNKTTTYIEPFITVAYYDNVKGLIANKQILLNENMFESNPTIYDIIDIDAYKPNGYNSGEIDYFGNVTYNDLQYKTIKVLYKKELKSLQVMYYKQTTRENNSLEFVGQSNISYNDDIDNLKTVTLEDIGYDNNLYIEEGYEKGVSILDNKNINSNILDSLEMLSVVYRPIEYTVIVNYYIDRYDEKTYIGNNTFSFIQNDLTSAVTLEDLGYNEKLFLPRGFQVKESSFIDADYHSSLFPNQSYGIDKMKDLKTIIVYYEPIPIEEPVEESKTITISYKFIAYFQEDIVTDGVFNPKYSITEKQHTYTLNTFPSSGAYLKDLIQQEIETQKPNQYYEDGVVQSNEYLIYDTLKDGATYEVLYQPINYSKNVRFYIDDFDEENYLGSTSLYYNIVSWKRYRYTGTQSLSLITDLGLNPNLFKLDYYSHPHIYIDDNEADNVVFNSFYDLYLVHDIKILYYTEEEQIIDYNEKLPNNLVLEFHNNRNHNWRNQISFHAFNISDLLDIDENPVASKLKYEIKFQAITKYRQGKYGAYAVDINGSGALITEPLLNCPIGTSYWYEANNDIHPYHMQLPPSVSGEALVWTRHGAETTFFYDLEYLVDAFPTAFVYTVIPAAEEINNGRFSKIYNNMYYPTDDDCAYFADRNVFGVRPNIHVEGGIKGARPALLPGFDFDFDVDVDVAYKNSELDELLIQKFLDMEEPYNKPCTLVVDYNKGTINNQVSKVLQDHRNELPPYELYIGAATDYRNRKEYGWGYHPTTAYIGARCGDKNTYMPLQYVENLDSYIDHRTDAQGLEYMRVWNAKFWYDGKLIHDYIPMQKGTTYWGVTAQENCLFDKITKTCCYPWYGKDFNSSLISTNVFTDSLITEQNKEIAQLEDSTVGKFLVWENDIENNQIGYIELSEQNELSPGSLNISATIRYEGNGLIFGLGSESDVGTPAEHLYSTIVSDTDAKIFGVTDFYNINGILVETEDGTHIPKTGFDSPVENTLGKNLGLYYRATPGKCKASHYYNYGELSVPYLRSNSAVYNFCLYRMSPDKAYTYEELRTLGVNQTSEVLLQEYLKLNLVKEIEDNGEVKYQITGYGRHYVESNSSIGTPSVPYRWLARYPKAPIYLGTGTLFSTDNQTSVPYTKDSENISTFAIKDLKVSSYNTLLHDFKPINTGETINGLTADAPGLYDSVSNKIFYVQNAKNVSIMSAAALGKK